MLHSHSLHFRLEHFPFLHESGDVMPEHERRYPSKMIGFWVHRLQIAMRSKLDEYAQEHGVSGTEAILITMLKHKGSTSLVELSTFLSYAHPSVLRHIDTLEERGVIERKPHPTDRRIKLVVLTEAGFELESKLNQMFHEVNEKAMAGMDEEEREHFLHTINKVTMNIGGVTYTPPKTIYPPGKAPEDARDGCDTHLHFDTET